MATSMSEKKTVQVSPVFQVILILLSSLIIAYATLNRLTRFVSRDEAPLIKSVTPKQLLQFGGFPGIVSIGLYISEFQKFDVIGNDFIFSGTIWFKFNPGIVSLGTIEKFNFERGEILSRSAADTELENDQIVAQYRIRIRFSSALNYQDFPFDDHRIFLILTHPFVSPDEILFESNQSQFIVQPKVKTAGWEFLDKSVQTGFNTAQLDPYNTTKTVYYPTAVFAMDYERYGIRYTLTLLLPLLIIFFLSAFSLSISEFGPKVSISSGGVTVILAYRFVIENMSPVVGYFMISDFIFFLTLGAAFLIWFINMVDVYVFTFSHMQKCFLLTVAHLLVTSTTTYILLFSA